MTTQNPTEHGRELHTLAEDLLTFRSRRKVPSQQWLRRLDRLPMDRAEALAEINPLTDELAQRKEMTP